MGERPPPDTSRGPRRELGPRARRFVDRVGATDRRANARERFQQVMDQEERTDRRRRAVSATAWSSAVIVLVVGGGLVAGWLGAGIGLAVVGGATGVSWLVRRAAAGRGATAWDWQARRYRLLGNPSAQVRDLDRRSDPRPDR